MKKDYRFLSFLSLILILVFACPSISCALPSPRRNISVEARWGYYVMDTPKWGESKFGRKYALLGGIKTNLELFRQILQLGIGIGYMREHEPSYYIYNIPIDASLNIRLKFYPEQLIVPYFGGGADYSYFKQYAKYLDSDNKPTITVLHNNRKGYHINAGLQLLLNRLDSGSGVRFDEKFGINATYLTLEARYSDLTNFDKLKAYETDVSGWFYYMGILFEF